LIAARSSRRATFKTVLLPRSFMAVSILTVQGFKPANSILSNSPVETAA